MKIVSSSCSLGDWRLWLWQRWEAEHGWVQTISYWEWRRGWESRIRGKTRGTRDWGWSGVCHDVILKVFIMKITT